VKKPYVAIVDDDSGFSSYLRTFLSLRGYDTRTYSRGDEVLAAIRQSDPPDVVLLDVMMPGLDGLATLRALKAARPETQAIMLSGREQASTIVEAVRLGAADYVVKPDDPEGLGEIALDVAIKNALEKNRLVSELAELRQQLSDDEDGAFLWGHTEQMRAVATVIEQVADSDVTVLIRGESGVGKELVSRAIHQRSPRRNKPLVKVNCAALPTELLESELFGHERGAFTGAATTRIGKFEQADGGTLLLDEIAEMKAALQAKLLHVLQDGEFSKLGSNRRQSVDVRVLAATNRDLEAMMLAGDFREDLYYRLKVIEITVPALRERRDEIPHLTDFFVAKYSRKYNRPVPTMSDQLRQRLLEHGWPGNIRELENMMKRLVILQDEQVVVRELRQLANRVPQHAAAAPVALAADRVLVSEPPVVAPPPPVDSVPGLERALPDAAAPAAPPAERTRSLAEVARAAAIKAERAAIERTLEQVRWNRRKAAQVLGVSYKTLLNKIKECGISQK
jgi:two-component system, NtrC family, response regulator AtoC